VSIHIVVASKKYIALIVWAEQLTFNLFKNGQSKDDKRLQENFLEAFYR